MGRDKKQAAIAKLPTEIAFDYVKSPHFRVIHADGVYGGLNPRGYLQLFFWNQRKAIPTKIVHKVNADGTIGDEIRREGREAIVREVDASIVMDLPLARSFLEWLTNHIEQAEQQTEAEGENA